jgi:hypothetical protein
MLLHAVCPSILQWSGRAVRLACAALYLLLAARTESTASTTYPSVHEAFLSASTLAGTPGSTEDHADEVQAGVRSRESLVVNATFASNSSSHTGTGTAPAAVSDASGSPPRTADSENHIPPDWNGIWRDTGIIFGSQVVAAGLIYIMPESVSNWSSEQKKNIFKKYAQNFVDPVIDKDKFYLNYVLHPYWGATYYIRGRERGLDKVPSIVYSALLSAMYEFGVECFFERPSIQDLIVTPVVGSLMGAFLFEPLRDAIKRKQELHWYDHAALIVTDPVGVLSLGIEKIFGIKSTIMVDYSVPQLQNRSTGSAAASKSTRIGVVMQFPLN